MAAPLSRVVITGIGLITPVGQDRETSWRGLQRGVTAIRDLAGLVPDDPAAWAGLAGAPVLLPPDDTRASGLGVRLAIRAAEEAWTDAGLAITPPDPEQLGCVIGASKPGFPLTAPTRSRPTSPHSAPERGPGAGGLLVASRTRTARVPPVWSWETSAPNAAVLSVAQRFQARAAALCPVAACATGLLSVVRGAELIQQGQCDVVLAGSSDASLSPLLLHSYRRLGVLARPSAESAAACRPFDRQRNGFLAGEGAAVFVLERLDRALDRGARPYAEWLAGAMAADPTGITQVSSEPDGLIWLLRETLRRANCAPEEIDYLSYHGTGTRDNDRAESRAVRSAFGAAADTLAGSSLKGTIGHLLAAAGSVELAATVLALRDGIIPPTANLTNPDSHCPLDYTPQTARPKPLQTALKVSLGFGGHLVAAILRRWN